MQPLEQARSLIAEIKHGGPKSPRAFSKLLNMILSSVVSNDHDKLECSKLSSDQWEIAPVGRIRPLNLNGGHFLLVDYVIDLDRHSRPSVVSSKIQYQLSADPDNWQEIFRYEFSRPTAAGNDDKNTLDTPPPSHFQIHAKLDEQKNVTLYKLELKRQHFPCGRVSIESIIRLLIRDFKIEPYSELSRDDLSTLLDTTEQAFIYGYEDKPTLGETLLNLWHRKK